jgi:transcriptional regulator
LGPLHGFGVARRIEETSRGKLTVRYGTLYPSLLKLEMEGFVRSKWGVSGNNRRAKYYALTPAGRKQLAREQHEWRETHAILSWFIAPEPKPEGA